MDMVFLHKNTYFWMTIMYFRMPLNMHPRCSISQISTIHMVIGAIPCQLGRNKGVI